MKICATRWSSSHNMLERLLKLRSFCEQMADSFKELHLSATQWMSMDATMPRIGAEENVLQYWKDRQDTNKELYELACIFNGIPCTQVSVERLFSGLKFIFTYFSSRTFFEPVPNPGPGSKIFSEPEPYYGYAFGPEPGPHIIFERVRIPVSKGGCVPISTLRKIR